MNAILARIDGLIYSGAQGEIEIKSTIVSDRGANSAEKRFGADFAITARIEVGSSNVEKAIIGQAKKGRVEELNSRGKDFFQGQILKMSASTDQYVILEVPEVNGNSPRIRLPYTGQPTRFKHPITIEDYITSKLIECMHGDLRPDFVMAVQDSDLSRLAIMVRI